MSRIEDRNNAQSKKSQSLRLDKQTIRTLTGAELKLVAGAATLCLKGSGIICTLPTTRLF